MASVKKRGDRWRAEVRRKGFPGLSKSFPTKVQADAWAAEQERAIEDRTLNKPGRQTVRQAFEHYAEKISPKKRTGTDEVLRGKRIVASIPFADRPLVEVTADDWINWRDARGLAPGSDIRDFSLIRHVYSTALRRWKWIVVNPLREVDNPPAPAGRQSTWKAPQIARQCEAMGWDGKSLETVKQRVAAGFLLSLETGMRQGEIFGLTPDRVFLDENFVRLDLTKNGEAREVPLNKRAREIMGLVMGLGLSPVFGVGVDVASSTFAAHRPAGLRALRFHDARHTAATKYGSSGKLTAFELCRMFGWKSMKMALRYFNQTASELASKLD